MNILNMHNIFFSVSIFWIIVLGVARFPIDVNGNPISGLCTGNAVSLNEDLINGDTSSTASHELAHKYVIIIAILVIW